MAAEIADFFKNDDDDDDDDDDDARRTDDETPPPPPAAATGVGGFPADDDVDTTLDLEVPRRVHWLDLDASRWYRVVTRRHVPNRFGGTAVLTLATHDGVCCTTYSPTSVHDRLMLLYAGKQPHQEVYLRPIREGNDRDACRLRRR